MMKRYKANNILDVQPDDNGAFVLYSDMTELMMRLLEKAVDAGADKDKLVEMLNDETKN